MAPLSGVEVVLGHLLVGVGSCEPKLHAATRVFGIGGVKVRVGPNLFTHGFGCCKGISPFSALAVCRTLVGTCERNVENSINLTERTIKKLLICTHGQTFNPLKSILFYVCALCFLCILPELQSHPLCQFVLQVKSFLQSSHHCSQSSLQRGTFKIRSFLQFSSA